MSDLTPEHRDSDDDRFAITGANPHTGAYRLAASLGGYKGRRPHTARALAWIALLTFGLFLVMWLVALLRT